MSNLEKIPAEWIERIFKRFDEIWGASFVPSFRSYKDFDLEMLRWQAGLIGCTADEIRRVLDMCRAGQIKDPPNVIEFYHYCKGNRLPTYKRVKVNPNCTPEIGAAYLQLIKDKLHGRITSEGQASLSALDKQVLENHKTQKEKPANWQDVYD